MTTIVVSESVKGKFGAQLKDVSGGYYSFSKFYKGETEFPAGTKLEADIYTTPKGNNYLNSVKVVGTLEVISASAPVAEAPKKAVKKAEFKAKDDTSMSKDEWAAKDRRISRQGCIQVAVQVMGDWDKATELADKMLGYVNKA